MSTLDLIQLLPIALRLFAGGSLTMSDWALFARILGDLLTPEHLNDAADWVKKVGPDFRVVLVNGQAWLEANQGPTPKPAGLGSADHRNEPDLMPVIAVTDEMRARFKLDLKPLKERGPG